MNDNGTPHSKIFDKPLTDEEKNRNRRLRQSRFKDNVNLTAMHNAAACSQAEREVRLRINLDKLEALQAEQKAATDDPPHQQD